MSLTQHHCLTAAYISADSACGICSHDNRRSLQLRHHRPSLLPCETILPLCCTNVRHRNPANPKYFSELLSTQVRTQVLFTLYPAVAVTSHPYTAYTAETSSLSISHDKTQHSKIAASPLSRLYGVRTRPRLFSIAETSFIFLPFSEVSGRSRKMATATTSKPNKLHGRAFYESIGSPKMVVAPMVDRSEFVSTRILTSRTQYLTNTTGLEGAYQIIYG
jgi:hypothetical protein